jgi:integrase/recombinase XerD
LKQTFIFRSALRSTITQYLELNFALGHRCKNTITALKSLDRFLHGLPRVSQNLNAEVFHSWCQSQFALTPRVRRYRMLIIRKFCLYRRRTVPGCFVPDPSLFPIPGQTVTPYIFSEAEVARLMQAASSLQRRPYSPLRPEVVRLAVVLLYTTGLRIGELLRLVIGDFDSREGTLLVRASKFHKSRILPLPQDVIRELKHYLQVRRQHNLFILPDTPLIWNRRHGERAYTAWGLQCCLGALLDACDIRTRSGGQPRVHDFRHSFAATALIRWYRAGADLRTKLPFLAAYLGHVSISSTYRYLHFVEPLRALASSRFGDSYGGLVVPLSMQEGGEHEDHSTE